MLDLKSLAPWGKEHGNGRALTTYFLYYKSVPDVSSRQFALHS